MHCRFCFRGNIHLYRSDLHCLSGLYEHLGLLPALTPTRLVRATNQSSNNKRNHLSYFRVALLLLLSPRKLQI